jgi:hypothetical protein
MDRPPAAGKAAIPDNDTGRVAAFLETFPLKWRKFSGFQARDTLHEHGRKNGGPRPPFY